MSNKADIMQKESDAFQAELKERYPDLLGNIYCGWSTGPGWDKILESLFFLIDSHVKSIESHNKWVNDHLQDPNSKVNKEYLVVKETPEPHVAQLKEKFGGLRAYIDNVDEYINGLVSMAEALSFKTCEDCGNPGFIRDGGWLRTMCDACYAPEAAQREAARAKQKAWAIKQSLKEISQIGQENQKDEDANKEV